MGSIVGKAMDDNMKKQQEFMLKTQTMQMERQIQMQNQMRERMMAMQIARGRDLFLWFGTFYGFATLGALMGMRRGKKAAILPMVPLTFLLGYQYDLAYGSKMTRMRAEADRIMDEEGQMLEMPHGLPTISSIESARLKQHDQNRLEHSNDIFL